MELVKKFLKYPHVRIILMHPPYTESQQRIIDSICRQCTQIIGQVLRKPPMEKTAEEIERLISVHIEPFVPLEQLQYVILGKTSLGGRVAPTLSDKITQ